METREGQELRDKWAAKGNPSCLHPLLEIETNLIGTTGHYICTACGARLKLVP